MSTTANNTKQHTMTQSEFTAALQAKFNKAEAAFDANPGKKTATVLSRARIALEEQRRAWHHTPAGHAANLAKLRGIAAGMEECARDIKDIQLAAIGKA